MLDSISIANFPGTSTWWSTNHMFFSWSRIRLVPKKATAPVFDTWASVRPGQHLPNQSFKGGGVICSLIPTGKKYFLQAFSASTEYLIVQKVLGSSFSRTCSFLEGAVCDCQALNWTDSLLDTSVLLSALTSTALICYLIPMNKMGLNANSMEINYWNCS